MKIGKMKRLAQKGKMSRREFVQLALAAGVTATMAETMFVQAVRAEPKKGGLFRAAIGHGATTDTLDPALWNNAMTADVGFIFGTPLTEIDQKTNVVGGLAESFEPSDGAKKWVFKLRKGVTFHNGKTVTADDVVATYNHHRNPDAKSAVKSILDQVEDVKADGGETVIFTLKSGSADFPYVASDYHLPIYAAKDGKIDWQSGVGTGRSCSRSSSRACGRSSSAIRISSAPTCPTSTRSSCSPSSTWRPGPRRCRRAMCTTSTAAI